MAATRSDEANLWLLIKICFLIVLIPLVLGYYLIRGLNALIGPMRTTATILFLLLFGGIYSLLTEPAPDAVRAEAADEVTLNEQLEFPLSSDRSRVVDLLKDLARFWPLPNEVDGWLHVETTDEDCTEMAAYQAATLPELTYSYRTGSNPNVAAAVFCVNGDQLGTIMAHSKRGEHAERQIFRVFRREYPMGSVIGNFWIHTNYSPCEVHSVPGQAGCLSLVADFRDDYRSMGVSCSYTWVWQDHDDRTAYRDSFGPTGDRRIEVHSC